MKKDKEWLKKYVELNTESIYLDGGKHYLIKGDNLNELINQLEEPQQEKVVVPQFVVDFITEIKPNFNIRAVFSLENDKHEQGQKWALDNPDVFARAWLDGYSVEKEKRYYVYDKATKSYLGYNAVRTQLNWWTSRLENESFTEQEIKAIDERYWAFAEEITK